MPIPPDRQYRVYNHSSQVLVIEIFDPLDLDHPKQFRLLSGCISPFDAKPRIVRTETVDAKIDGVVAWSLTPGFDAHVSETRLGTEAKLHIAGLGLKAADEEGLLPRTHSNGVWAAREDEIWVTVLGAGVTGLTAAHELVTRGFRVQVIEKAHGSPADQVDSDTSLDRFERGLRSPDVGGIARTQWTTPPLEAGALSVSREHRRPESLVAMRSVHGDCHWFGAAQTKGLSTGDYSAYGVPWTKTGIDPTTAMDLLGWLRDLSTKANRSVAAVQLVVVVYRTPTGLETAETALETTETGLETAEAYRRFAEFKKWLSSTDADVTDLRGTLDHLEVFPTARIDVNEVPAGDPFVGLLVRVHEDLGLVAGEHGFRFFPGFYRHLRDTMRRTPIYDAQTQTFTARSADDNLIEVDWQVIADPTRPNAAALSRKPLTTVAAIMDQYRALRRNLGYRPIDLLRFLLRMLRYMTSSTERRETYYEQLSWWDFSTLKRFDEPTGERFTFGARFEEALHHAPKALIAMDADSADARTYGNVTTQLFMDQFDLHEESDSTLSGPTSTSWLADWRTYLEEQGVRFFLGEVTAIGANDGGRVAVRIVFPDGTPKDYIDGEEAVAKKGSIFTHYYLSALDLVNLARLTRDFRAPHRKGRDYGVLTELAKLVGPYDAERDLEDITQIGSVTQIGVTGGGQPLADRFQTLTGIQLYYRPHVSFENGHIYFAASPWGLSAISQIQYWGPFGSGRHNLLLGNLSVDIGSWRAGPGYPSPNTLTRDIIAHGVQAQIQDSLKRLAGVGDFTQNHYHLDDCIGFAQAALDPKDPATLTMVPNRNHAPFLINVVGEWNLRPVGSPWSPSSDAALARNAGGGNLSGDVWKPDSGGYPVHFGNLVIAGTHLRTYTRLGTMESANESARHAVNTILDHATSLLLSHRETGRTSARSPLQPAASRPPIEKLAEPLRPGLSIDKATTPFGDYCDIWDPELYEFPDLAFLRLIDSYLMKASVARQSDDAPRGAPPVAPHLFDILRLDELPDWIDDDATALGAFDLIGSAFKAFDDANAGDVPSILAVVEQVRKKLAHLFQRPAR